MPVITHVALDNNIHELVFAESSHDAIDQFLVMLIDFYKEANDNSAYVVLDMRESGMLPLRYLTKSLRRLFEQYPVKETAKIALVLEDPQMLNVTRALLGTIMRRESVQYFTQIEEARTWLQLEQNKWQ